MGRFIYHVRDGMGRYDNGVLMAQDMGEASHLLRGQGKTVISIREEVQAAVAAPRRRVKQDDVVFFATQLAVMVDTGVQLTEALDAIGAQTGNETFKDIIAALSDQVKGGKEFSAALLEYPNIFPPIFVALMKASEASGTMGAMLQRVSDYLASERETRKRIQGAMTYPLCMLSFCVLVVVGMLIFVLPRFEKIYGAKGSVLPLPTRFLLGLSHAIVDYWYLILTGLAGLITALYFYLHSESGRDMLDRIKLRIPVVGSMYRKGFLARSLRTMATMVSTGVTMLDGLEITAQVAGNRMYAAIWKGLAEKVKQGSTLAEHLYSCPLIPRTMSQMIEAGERTGRLGQVMDRVAQFCEDDLKIAVKTMTNMIEPIMIIVMGVLVGGIAMALLLPVFSLSKVVAH